jgi:hypothetical protein
MMSGTKFLLVITDMCVCVYLQKTPHRVLKITMQST